MTRHVVDRHSAASTRRTAMFFRLDRALADEARHPKIRMLSRRLRDVSTEPSRVRHFMRIARGHLA